MFEDTSKVLHQFICQKVVCKPELPNSCAQDLFSPQSTWLKGAWNNISSAALGRFLLFASLLCTATQPQFHGQAVPPSLGWICPRFWQGMKEIVLFQHWQFFVPTLHKLSDYTMWAAGGLFEIRTAFVCGFFFYLGFLFLFFNSVHPHRARADPNPTRPVCNPLFPFTQLRKALLIKQVCWGACGEPCPVCQDSPRGASWLQAAWWWDGAWGK